MKNINGKGFRKNPKNPYSDFFSDKPCKVKVKKAYMHTGNVVMGYKKFGDSPWRWGKELKDLHPLTIIEVETVGKFEVPTEKVLQYLALKDFNLVTISGSGFGFPTESYIVPIKDLVEFCDRELTNV